MACPGPPRPRDAPGVPLLLLLDRGDEEALCNDPHEFHLALAAAEDVQPGGGSGLILDGKQMSSAESRGFLPKTRLNGDSMSISERGVTLTGHKQKLVS